MIGYLGNNPEEYQTKSGKEMVKISVSLQGKDDNVSWVPVIAFDKLADIIKHYFKKGDRVHVAGKLSVTDRQTKSGEPFKGFSIIANDIINLTPKEKVSVQQECLDAGRDNAAFEELDDAIPF